MRTFPVISCLLANVLCGSAMAASLKAADHRVESQLCVSAATQPAHQFKQDAAQQHLSVAMLANKLQCNDQPIASFARQYGNTAVASQLGRYQRGHVDIEVISSADVPLASVAGAISPN